ncbi:FAD-dependent oxidoreductase [Thalassotalea psychrophila]|uniref:FAD-dependent oxidoreductase n=1 Tax=Thalassotalea psychrophila TaxID=3065647 RepID=A0ABY9TTD7_9GAMM|nr:FAD-dependent oxidoreductase [Colwelliaceae bacterium SQ149]
MTREPRFDILFEPLKIGPVTAKNRFYQVPHCTGMGWQRPNMLAAMRGMKAEGGWGVINTEYCSIHPSSDDLLCPYASLWDKSDIRAHLMMTEKMHEHGALAGVELWYGGATASNLYTRNVPFDVNSKPSWKGFPFQSRKMDKQDFRDLRQWYKDAALRAKEAGFDIVYAYANHNDLLHNFQRVGTNDRTDEYGGSVQNRSRLLRETIEVLKDTVGDTMAVAVRFSPDDERMKNNQPVTEETREFFMQVAELPDLWDVTAASWDIELGTSRFVNEGGNEPYMSYVKEMTSKPVVAVGRFTSPDTMVNQIKRGVVDMIGAARPSIADPFLPKKVEEGRFEDIRECIGCNMCYTGDQLGIPIRCTQNPTMGEEWRRGWHPENIREKGSESSVLVIGAGPAGLEATHALGKRGYNVMLSEARKEIGGRVAQESRLPSLSEWVRVKDYREQQFLKLPNVDVFLDSKLTAEEALMAEADHIVIATGAKWRSDGFGRTNTMPIENLNHSKQIFTPDDIMAGRLPEGRVVVFDDDYYYMGPVIAEMLQRAGCDVTFVSTADMACSFGVYTTEQPTAQKSLMEAGVKLVFSQNIDAFDGENITLECMYTEQESSLKADAIVMVTARLPTDNLYYELQQLMEDGKAGATKSICRIGDCEAPGPIASAVYSGRLYAEELDDDSGINYSLRRDVNFQD